MLVLLRYTFPQKNAKISECKINTPNNNEWEDESKAVREENKEEKYDGESKLQHQKRHIDVRIEGSEYGVDVVSFTTTVQG